ncbi:MAG: polysaccharide deacetylase [Herpetosiphonaceae bacterium]|nr:MAG: polysaccharide deacetylase [Herpetosiphonaceae bacterium]
MRRRLYVSTGVLLLLTLLGLAWGLRERWEQSSPERFTSGNILYNADFSRPDARTGRLPDGWSAGGPGVALGAFTFRPDSRSVEIFGSNNYLKSPLVTTRPGQRFRLGFRVLCESQTPSRVRVWFHWLDEEGDEIIVEKRPWREAPARTWGTVLEEVEAPDGAAYLTISLHPAADDRLFIDTLSLNVSGVRVLPWPEGRAAAISLSVDWETAMGGLIHSRSGDPGSAADAVARGLRMREGTHQLLALLRPYNLRATWFANGYNFLEGNPEGRTFLGDPVFTWADDAHRWPDDRWASAPWFAADPHGTYVSHPAWYFGDLVPQLLAEKQAIESHTFSHFYGGFVEPELWRADLAAWNEVAAERGVGPASALAFPWSGSDGMTEAKWHELEQAGITVLTRTSERSIFRISRDDLLIPRPHPGFRTMLVFPDAYLTPATLTETLLLVDRAVANGGALDIWAHTEEITSPEQIAAWRMVIERCVASGDLWIAPLTELAGWWRAIRQVEAVVIADGPPLRLRIENRSDRSLSGVALQLPVEALRAEVDGQPFGRIVGDTLILNIGGRQTLEVDIWPAS